MGRQALIKGARRDTSERPCTLRIPAIPATGAFVFSGCRHIASTSPPHTARYMATGAKLRPAVPDEPGRRTPDGAHWLRWQWWTLLDAGPGSTRHRGVLVIFLLDKRGRPARRNGENEWHLPILFLHFHHLEVLVLRLLRRDIISLEELQTVPAADPWEHSTGITGQRLGQDVRGVVRPQTLKTEAVGIGTQGVVSP